MNRPAEVFLQGLQCIEDAIYIGRANTFLALNVLNDLEHTLQVTKLHSVQKRHLLFSCIATRKVISDKKI